ncbi:MAG: hypothetical protein EXX96DRAFT_27583 [Benjaminiella poitrasii]|nr:MAG: hypothetical protein EXX96DRAFT_27583 [Benjaminiella poitrasii]
MSCLLFHSFLFLINLYDNSQAKILRHHFISQSLSLNMHFPIKCYKLVYINCKCVMPSTISNNIDYSILFISFPVSS